MRLKHFCIVIIFLFLCFILVGCGNTNNNENVITSENNSAEQAVQNSTEELRPEIKTANTWMSMPQNVNMIWRTEEKASNNWYSLTEEYKRGNNVMVYPIHVENGKYITGANNGIANEYYYYHFKGDYKWNSYVYFHNIGWDSWYFKGNYPSSPQVFCFGRPWNILDNYSDNHETITIEGVGSLDTVTGVDDEGYTYYYSKDLNMNVKIENNVQTWYLTKFDTNVSSNFPYALPDMEAIDAKEAEKAKETANNIDTSNSEDNSQDIYEDENGELIIYDD